MAWQHSVVAVKRTLVGRRRQRMRDLVFSEQPICCDCNRRPSAELDHEIPIEEGGSDERSNLRGRCVECHKAKTQRVAARGVVRTGWGGS
ncbi:MAG: HNH endonuclease signature motif containing protein, partial [Rhodoglobus sp.]|nr:HNH endonuclease signature motif containing protein [Rhodoglobus sp.]